jgi:thiamine biosynthesis protein ThiI
MTLAIMRHGGTQETVLNILEDGDIRQTCLFCRMQMFRKAQAYAHQVGADVIVTGEILGEQASQTLDNLPVVASKVDILALRPLLGYNKEEVIQLSKEWGLYDISIRPGGCCSINPKYPETKGRLEIVDPIYYRFTEQFRTVMDKEVDAVETFSLPVNSETVLSQIET